MASNGFRVLSAYMLNALQSPIGDSGARCWKPQQSFTTSLLGRLDSRRLEGVRAYSIYAMGGLAGADNDAAGLDGNGGRGVIGVEIALNENLLGGLTLGYSSRIAIVHWSMSMTRQSRFLPTHRGSTMAGSRTDCSVMGAMIWI
jgi:hypothetical protein